MSNDLQVAAITVAVAELEAAGTELARKLVDVFDTTEARKLLRWINTKEGRLHMAFPDPELRQRYIVQRERKRRRVRT